MSKLPLRAAICAAMMLAWPLARGADDCDVDALNVALENDALGVGHRTDRWYTAGGRLTWAYRCARPDGPVGALAQLPALMLGVTGARPPARVAGQIGQNLYTPQDLRRSTFIPYDRPYAGWAYASVIAQRRSGRWVETADLKLGATGPASMAEQVQRTTHRLLGTRAPDGWAWQLRPSAGVEAGYAVRGWLPLSATRSRAGLVPLAGMVAGNLRVIGYGAMALVIGPGADAWRVAPLGEGVGELLPPAHQPMATSDEGVQAGGSWALSISYAFAHVARNRFIDGDTFGGQPVITLRHPVTQAGIGLSFGLPRGWFGRPGWLDLSVYDRSPEFGVPGYGLSTRQRVGRLSLTLML